MKKRTKKLLLLQTMLVGRTRDHFAVMPAKVGIHAFRATPARAAWFHAVATTPRSKSFFASFFSKKEALKYS